MRQDDGRQALQDMDAIRRRITQNGAQNMNGISMSTINALNEIVDLMLKYNPATAKKLKILGYDNEEFVEKKLRAIERKNDD